MPERRQAHRREPIIVEVRGVDLEARPLPWLQRNDLGNAVIRQYTEMMNSTMRSYVNPETNAPELEMYLNDKLQDPIEIIQLGYPDMEIKPEWEYPELYDLIYAALDVNDLEHLKELVDPNSLTPTSNGGTNSSGTQPTRRAQSLLSRLSSPNSDSVDSPEAKSEASLTAKSSTRSEKKTGKRGKTAGGRSRKSSTSP